jgi:1-acyl-sn-glycerol-3-phosphate acyltransferase
LRTQYFPADIYYTDPGLRKNRLSRWLKNRRIYFLIKFTPIVIRSRRQALKGIYDLDAWIKSSYDIFRLLEFSGGRFSITGLDNIRNSNKPVVIVSNHMSTLETLIFPCLIAQITDATFVVKDNLVEHPVFGPIIRSREPVVVGRTNSREDLVKVMTGGSDLLKKSITMIIFPQSTRKSYFSQSEFNSLGAKLAARNNVNIIPAAIKTDFWSNGKIVKDLGPLDRKKPVYVSFGKEIEVSGNGREAHEKVVKFITDHLNKWGVEVKE